MKLSEELKWRGFINQTTFANITELDDEKRTFYWGCDPSSDSLQIGNLAGAMMARVFISHGYTPILLVGGATGMIGDPKDNEERNLKTVEEIAKNKAAISEQYRKIFDDIDFTLVDNYDWFKDIKYLDFLRDVGKQFSMTQLLDREFVQSRIGKDSVGISYAEFSYSLIQGYDFLHLYKNYNVTLQIGGSDQWGNMISGIPLIRKLENAEAHVWTLPLVVDKTTGRKFGKSEQGTIWLSATKTSVYKFYQFWLNSSDENVGDYLKIYTTIKPDEFSKLIQEFESNPAGRSAQKYLAYEVTKIVHGKASADNVRSASEVLFGARDFRDLSQEAINELKAELPCVSSKDVVDAITKSGIANSNSQARRLIESGAVSLNGDKIDINTDLKSVTKNNDYILLKAGKNSFALIEYK